jgi:ribose 5-phosphate isomerase B
MLYIAADHAGYDLKKRIIALCTSHNIKALDVYDTLDIKDDYPDVAQLLAQKIEAEGDDARGLAICGTAEGICMALNRFDYIRAATVDSPYITSIVRRHNQANVICIPGPYSKKDLTDKLLLEIIETFLYTDPDTDERHIRRVNKLSQL